MLCYNKFMNKIPHNKPLLGEEEAKAAADVIKSQWIIAGPEVEKFEKTIASYVGKRYAVALNSGHASLHLSLLALGVGENDEVITTAYTTPDLLNVINYCRATPVIVDILPDSFNIDSSQIKLKLTSHTKAIIVPHIFGFAAEIDTIKTIGIPVIEDCAQSIGTIYNGKPTGSYGDISMFSFYASKLITTGQGGMVVTDDEGYYKKVKDLINYNGPDYYITRYNYPMTDIAAALGNVQFGKMQSFIDRKKQIAELFKNVLRKKQVRYWPGDSDTNVNYFRFLVQLENEKQMEFVKEDMAKREITCIIPYHANELPHRILNLNLSKFPNTERILHTVLSIPIFAAMTDEEVERVAAALEETL